MGARLRVFLTREQDRTLFNLRTTDVPQKVKDRAEVVRLNAHGWYVEKIAAHVNWTSQTVREVLHKWKKHGLEGLWDRANASRQTKSAFADSREELPLLELFTQLRESGLLLGIDEYKLLLTALQKGFGGNRESLKRLCYGVWIKSHEERRIFDYHFDLLFPDIFDNVISTPEPQTPSVEIEDIIEPEVIPRVDDSIEEKTLTASNPELTLAMEDEMQAAKAFLENTSSAEDVENMINHINHNFILTSEYLPVTKRQMKQCWRYLRRPIREGIPVELDLEATINKIGQQGILLAPVLVPRRVNRSELLLLIDRDGSMVPFHDLSQRLAETAMRGGRLGNAGIYYFHNCPVDYLYHDPHHLEAESIANSLLNLRADRTGILIFSDAGAARGGYSEERIELTAGFLNQIKTKVRYIAWLNPMPKSRWEGTTAGEVAKLVPMFELTQRGLQNAITLLRGSGYHSSSLSLNFNHKSL
jgi:uncharacterized protein with von Willebrand factor type A (vWA) domain